MGNEEYIKTLKKFNPFRDSGIIPTPLTESELPPLVRKILSDIREEKGLTYVDAYGVLECTYDFLKQESNFVTIPK